MSDTYTKLFSSITESTIVSEPLATRWLWVTLLAMADAGGCVYGSIPGLARRANISLEETEAALATFYAPDAYSRTKEHGGRRIEDIDGGWRLLNHAKYRDMGIRSGSYGELLNADGYVYYAGSEGRIKIGFSKNPWARIATLKTADPRIELLGIERGGMALEKTRQAEFCDDRIDGEWYAASDGLLSLIGSLDRQAGKRTARGAVPKVATHVATPVVTVATTTHTQHQKEQQQKTAPLGELLAGVSPQVVADFKALRTKVRAPITKTAVDGIAREAAKAGMSLEAALVVCCERGWRGFKAEWLNESRGRGNETHRESAADRSARLAREGDERDRRAGIER